MAELKGGTVLNTKRDSSLMKLYTGDIEKLGEWRRLAGRRNHARDSKLPPIDFVFVGVDLRNCGLDHSLLGEHSQQARHEGIRFVYVHLPATARNAHYAT